MKLSYCLLIIFSGLLLTAAAQTQAAETQAGFKAGLLFEGGVTVDSGTARDFDADSGFMLGGFMDIPWQGNLSYGPFVDYSSFTAADNDGVGKLDIGAAVRYHIDTSGDIKLRPFVSVAYGMADMDEDPVIGFVSESSNDLFVYSVGIEAVYQNYIFDFAYTEASGGNEEDVYFWGQTYLRAGILY
jgi:hypothetical protein